MSTHDAEFKPDAAYDEIAGEIKVGDLLRVQEFKPPFVIVRVTKFVVPERQKGAEQPQPYIEITAEPWRLPVSLGKMHSGLVRVVDPESDKLLNRAAAAGAGAGENKRREVVKIDEHGNKL